MMIRLTLIFLCSGLVSIQAEEGFIRTTFGIDPALTAGADALRVGDYEEGVNLILEGLNSTVSRRNKVRALSNLCAGYVGIKQFTKALESCDQALELDARNWHVYNNRALALLGVGLVVAARNDLEKGMALNPYAATLEQVARLIDAQEREQLKMSRTDIDSN